jgi:hypothetical protein
MWRAVLLGMTTGTGLVQWAVSLDCQNGTIDVTDEEAAALLASGYVGAT